MEWKTKLFLIKNARTNLVLNLVFYDPWRFVFVFSWYVNGGDNGNAAIVWEGHIDQLSDARGIFIRKFHCREAEGARREVSIRVFLGRLIKARPYKTIQIKYGRHWNPSIRTNSTTATAKSDIIHTTYYFVYRLCWHLAVEICCATSAWLTTYIQNLRLKAAFTLLKL